MNLEKNILTFVLIFAIIGLFMLLHRGEERAGFIGKYPLGHCAIIKGLENNIMVITNRNILTMNIGLIKRHDNEYNKVYVDSKLVQLSECE